jgi:hypothetical protein
MLVEEKQIEEVFVQRPKGVYSAFEMSCTTQGTVRQKTSKESTVMNPFKRLWQWYKDRRIERHMFKGQGGLTPPVPRAPHLLWASRKMPVYGGSSKAEGAESVARACGRPLTPEYACVEGWAKTPSPAAFPRSLVMEERSPQRVFWGTAISRMPGSTLVLIPRHLRRSLQQERGGRHVLTGMLCRTVVEYVGRSVEGMQRILVRLGGYE